MLRTRLLGATALFGTLAIGTPAFAQTPAPATVAETEATDSTTGDEVVVTGSRIRRPNVESAVPVTSIGGEEFFQQGQTNVGDTLNDLPQLRSTFAQQNPGAGVGIAGLNLLDLRGLGTVRTLVLVNGRRHVPADILNNASSPDVNTIPNDLIERVDIVTGGNSAVYGSDAIAGVVNFVLRRDFDGVQVRGQAGIAEAGFGGNQYVSAMAGKNFADGRGNVTIHGEYARAERVYASDVPWYRRVDNFAVVDADSAGLANGSDGFPDQVFFRDIRSATNHRYGLVGVPQAPGAGACGTGTLANNGPSNTNGTPFHCNFIFTPDGRLTPQTGTRFGTGPGGTFVGGNGMTGREGTQLSILPFTERYNANLLAHYEVSPALELFFEGKYTKVNAVGNQLGPTFLNNSTASLRDGRISPRLDNPYLNSADRTTIANAILATPCTFPTNASSTFGTVTCTPVTGAALAARNAAIANGSYRFLFARNMTDLPDRDEYFTRQTYRFVAGARGTFNDDWSYELSANYGKFKEKTDMRGFVNVQRFALAMDAGRNPVTNAIECRAKFDPASATGVAYTGSAAALAADIAACVPYNPFGDGSGNAAAIAYFSQPLTNRSSISQLDIQGFVSGDLSQLFELPGGPVRFVIGGEYRREKAFNDSDSAADTGISNSVFLGDVDAKPLKVKEAYGELQIPILADTPFFHELTLTGAGRISDYNNAVGTVYTYNGGVEWAPVRDLRFRANYGRAVRAPNVTENAFPNVANFANNFVDPCNPNAIGQNGNRSANCSAELSAAQIANLPPAGYSLGVISGSNPNLNEEKSDSYTIGGVFTPRFLPGFSLSVDYFDITVKDVIVTLTAQVIANSCYDSPGKTAPTCALIQRNLSGNGTIVNNTLVQGPNNFAKRVRRGLDVEAAYRRNLSEDINLSTRFIYTHQFQNSNFENPTFSDLENRLLSEVGDPKDEFRWNLDVGFGPLTVGYVMRYLGNQLVTTYENVNEFQAGCTPALTAGGTPVCPPLNADAFDVFNYGSVVYHNLRFDYNIGGNSSGNRDGFNFFFGVDNLANKKPPLGTTATGVGTAIYAFRGRNYYAGFRARF